MSFISRLWSGHNRDDGDNPELSAYAQAMERGEPFIRMKLDVHQPMELGEFVGAFTALAAEYDRYVRGDSGKGADATLFVRDVRDGCVVAEIVALGAGALSFMGGANTVADFVKTYGGALAAYLVPGGRVESAGKQQLRDFLEQTAVIANTPGSNLQISALRYENGAEKIDAAFQFDTSQAREIQERVTEHKRELDHTSRSDHERVLMVFVRSDIRGAAVGKRSGELVKIEALSDKPRPLIYASAMAEQEIKAEIADDESVYRKGFVVDVNVETRGGKPVAYAVTNMHQVVDLPDDDEG